MTTQALLILQGGGSLGAYQCGAYRAISTWLQKTGVELIGIAGASIGAVNGALIAHHQSDSDRGASALESFWRKDLSVIPYPFFPLPNWYQRCWNGLLSMLLYGNPGLSTPNYLAWSPWGTSARARAALHDTEPMERLLTRRFTEYGPNRKRYPLLLVRAVNASTQQPAIFHSWREAITPRHLVASASVPLLFPLTRMADESYWDGDLVPQSPLMDLLSVLREQREEEQKLAQYLVIIVDTMCGAGRAPASAPDLLYQVQAALQAPRSDSDERYAEANNRHVDFLNQCAAVLEAHPASALKDWLTAQYASALRGNLGRLNIVRIRRERALPFEYVSRDLDYSLERLNYLIEQGFRQATRVLAGYS